jgi:hypothetical protein
MHRDVRGPLPVDGQREVGQRVVPVGIDGTIEWNARNQPLSSVRGGSATLIALPTPAPRPVSSGNPVPGNSESGLWCRLIVSTLGSS